MDETAPNSERSRSARAARDELRVTLTNDLSELARVNRLTEELLRRCGTEERVVYAVELALEEILSNVIRHGYADGGRHEIALHLCASRDGAELEVVDDGRAFDPVTAPEPELDVPLAERRAGGLGIHLVRAFTTEMRYERVGDRNVLHLRI